MLAEQTGTYTTESTAIGTTGNGFWVQIGADIVVLDPGMTPISTIPIGTTWRGAHAVTPSRVAVSDSEEIRLLDHTGATLWRFPHTPWGTGYSVSGSCGIAGDGRTVYATVPETDTLLADHAGVGAYDEDNDDGQQASYGDQWIAFDAGTGEPTRWWYLDAEATASFALAHPDGTRMALAVGLGQDGARFYLTAPGGDLLTSPDHSRMLAAITPGHLLSVPSAGPGATGVALHDETLGVRLERDVRDPGEWWSPIAGYADGRILIRLIRPDWAWSRDIVLDAGLNPLGEIDYPVATGGALAVSAGGTWVTGDGTTLTGWRLRPLSS